MNNDATTKNDELVDLMIRATQPFLGDKLAKDLIGKVEKMLEHFPEGSPEAEIVRKARKIAAGQPPESAGEK